MSPDGGNQAVITPLPTGSGARADEVQSMSVFCVIDDKHVPLYRILWVSALPHFCGSSECQQEGNYEVRLEQGESVWCTTPEERDAVLRALEAWASNKPPGPQES